MDRYVTGSVIRKLRERCGMTQDALAEKLHVSGKTVSKWETGQGLPDIALLEPLADALQISMIELFAGAEIKNSNRSANMLRSKFYVCPVCGNVLHALGEAVVSCCGITLPPLLAEEPDEEHQIHIETIEDAYYVTVDHPMTKLHSISFLAALSDQSVQIVKRYPEGNAEAYFSMRRVQKLYAYCNHHGFFCVKA